MKKVSIYIILCSTSLLFSSCSDKHLKERIFQNGNIKIVCYEISEITSSHDFIEIQKDDKSQVIMKANTGGIYDFIFKNDTIVIQTVKDLIIYSLEKTALGNTIILDSTITQCQYTRKYNSQNAKYVCPDSTD